MDLHQTIRQLHAEKKRLDRVIAALEQLPVTSESGPLEHNRRRKYMTPKERREVSARMKRWWAKRRGQT